MRINPPTLFWILIAAIVAVDQFSPLVAFTVPWLPWVGAGLIISGVGISAAGKSQFLRAGTNVYTFEEPGELVSEGLYRFSRNPMYLGLVLAGTGTALVSATLAALVLAAVFAAIVRYGYIEYEEHAMQHKFGKEYEAYCRMVGRWLGRYSDAGRTARSPR